MPKILEVLLEEQAIIPEWLYGHAEICKETIDRRHIRPLVRLKDASGAFDEGGVWLALPGADARYAWGVNDVLEIVSIDSEGNRQVRHNWLCCPDCMKNSGSRGEGGKFSCECGAHWRIVRL